MGVGLLGLVLVSSVLAQSPSVSLSPEMRALLSRLQAMGHGSATAAEINEVFEQIHVMLERAEGAGDYDAMIEVTVLLSRVHSDMLGNHAQALKILREMKGYLAEKRVSRMPQLYVREAEVLARLGDERSIVELIRDFRASPHYDPESYSVAGGAGPDDPIRIQRPSASGDDSVSVTAMRRALQEARFAPGKPFPPATGQGRFADWVQGRVVLLDFWHPNWPAWKQDLPTLKSLYSRYHAAGFEIVGLPLGMPLEHARATAAELEMPWPQQEATADLMRQAGVAGQAANLLIGPDGTILGRNLRGQALVDALGRTGSRTHSP